MTQQTNTATPDKAPGLTLRIDLGAHGAIGPGKVRLLELIDEHGSITLAGRAMGMSYRRAWSLVDGLDRMFRDPVVITQAGGTGGGGTRLAERGRAIVARYRAMERAAETALSEELRAFQADLDPTMPGEA